MYYLIKIVERHNHLKPYYFIQDYEPYFYSEDEKALRMMVERTYTFPADRFAKTEWIVEKVSSHGVAIGKVPPGLDLDIFYPRGKTPRDTFNILTMMRPSTKHRGFDTMAEVLTRIMERRRDVEIHSFGSSDAALREFSLSFHFVNHGILTPEQLARRYSESNLFIDFSLFHGFGRTALEAMACGTPCVMTDSGGVSEYAVDGVNCLLSPQGDVSSLVANIEKVIEDSTLRETIIRNGLTTVQQYEKTYSSRKTWEYMIRAEHPAIEIWLSRYRDKIR
jgi:glycosyltransferase involved in cell wall biosynthesis